MNKKLKKVVLVVLGILILIVVFVFFFGAGNIMNTLGYKTPDGSYCEKYVLENYKTEEGIEEEVFIKRFNECLESRGVPSEYWLQPSSQTPQDR